MMSVVCDRAYRAQVLIYWSKVMLEHLPYVYVFVLWASRHTQ